MRAPKRPGQPGGTGMTLCCSGRPLKLSNTARALYPRSDVCYSPSAALIYRCPHLPLPSSAAALICRCPHLPLPSSASSLICRCPHRGGAKPLSSLYTNSKYVETWFFCSSFQSLLTFLLRELTAGITRYAAHAWHLTECRLVQRLVFYRRRDSRGKAPGARPRIRL